MTHDSNAAASAPLVLPAGVDEALQRLIENAATMGPASRDDALLVAKHRASLATPTPQVAEPAPSELFRIALHEWAVAGWRSEVQHRPLVNIHRKRLDDFWRHAIRHGGGDPAVLVGPSHDDLIESMRANTGIQAAPSTPGTAGDDAVLLDWVLAAGAFIVWTVRDGSIRQCQVWTQDEDEVFHQPAGEDRFFNSERDAIRAAMKAASQGGAR